MNHARSAFSLGFYILGLSLVSALCRAEIPRPPAEQDAFASGSYSAATLYNLGNSYARTGKTALAVLNYERARLLAPRDPDIAANLKSVRNSASVPAAPKLFEGYSRLLSPNTAYWLGFMGMFLAGISGLLLALKRSPRVIAAAVLVGGVLIVAYAFSNAAATAYLMHEAVVMVPASASASPITNTEPLFSLLPATVVQIQESHGNFSLIRDANGNVGWVPKSELSRIIDFAGDVHA